MGAEAQSWKAHLIPDGRLKIVDKIMHVRRRSIPVLCPEGLLEFTEMAVEFEEKVYNTAFDRNDYLRKICLNVLRMGTAQNDGVADVLQQNHPDPGRLNSKEDLQDLETSWRVQFPADYRLRILNKILDTSRTHFPITTPKELLETTESAVTFEKNIYTSATDESDYLSKIAMKMLSMEVNSQNSDVATPLPQNAVIID